jgi:hypothetical protein
MIIVNSQSTLTEESHFGKCWKHYIPSIATEAHISVAGFMKHSLSINLLKKRVHKFCHKTIAKLKHSTVNLKFLGQFPEYHW